MDVESLRLETSEIVVTTLRSVHIGKECHIHLSLIQEIHPQTKATSFAFYQLVVKGNSGSRPSVSVKWTRDEALREFTHHFNRLYYSNLN